MICQRRHAGAASPARSSGTWHAACGRADFLVDLPENGGVGIAQRSIVPIQVCLARHRKIARAAPQADVSPVRRNAREFRRKLALTPMGDMVRSPRLTHYMLWSFLRTSPRATVSGLARLGMDARDGPGVGVCGVEAGDVAMDPGSTAGQRAKRLRIRGHGSASRVARVAVGQAHAGTARRYEYKGQEKKQA